MRRTTKTAHTRRKVDIGIWMNGKKITTPICSYIIKYISLWKKGCVCVGCVHSKANAFWCNTLRSAYAWRDIAIEQRSIWQQNTSANIHCGKARRGCAAAVAPHAAAVDKHTNSNDNKPRPIVCSAHAPSNKNQCLSIEMSCCLNQCYRRRAAVLLLPMACVRGSYKGAAANEHTKKIVPTTCTSAYCIHTNESNWEMRPFLLCFIKCIPAYVFHYTRTYVVVCIRYFLEIRIEFNCFFFRSNIL